MRLDKYLCDLSFGTRKEIKNIIKDSRVKVNDVIILDAGYQVKENDNVFLDGNKIEYVQYEYYLLNKPAGYLSATYDPKNPVIMDLISSIRKDLVPVGRLDKDTEGIIMITNDGVLNHRLLSANNHVSKTYYVQTDVLIPTKAVEVMSKPIEFKEFTSLPGKLEIIGEKEAYLTICEGKYHQVKRMFEHVGCTVTYLRRDKFACLDIDGLEIGQYRPLTNEEINSLKELVK